jgi:rod shape determining protein RodA
MGLLRKFSFGVILCYLYWQNILFGRNSKNTFNRVFGYCFAGILLMHFSINLGMVMGLFPTVGIPLPYFSYGGVLFSFLYYDRYFL